MIEAKGDQKDICDWFIHEWKDDMVFVYWHDM